MIFTARKEKIMRLGVIIYLEHDVDTEFKKVHDLGFTSCQLGCWNVSYYTDERAEQVNAAMKKYGVSISTFWGGWTGPKEWNFTGGPHTLGIVPTDYRFMRCEQLKAGSDFAKKVGAKNFATHVGFIPEVPTCAEYQGLISALNYVTKHVNKNGQTFLFETGQETPVTLLRTIEALVEKGRDVGINLDPANLILYGKANPVDALDVFGKYVREVHGKDGNYPTDGIHLGKETRLGEGKVNYPAFIAKLKEIGYDGTITIEREISGDEQIKDILDSKKLLEELINA